MQWRRFTDVKSSSSGGSYHQPNGGLLVKETTVRNACVGAKLKCPTVATEECHTPLDGRAWEFGMGWVKMSERDLRRAEVLALPQVSWRLSFFYEVLGCSCGFIPDDARQVAGHAGR
jgi:hypothetical protein